MCGTTLGLLCMAVDNPTYEIPAEALEYKSSVAIHPKPRSDLCFHDQHSLKGKISEEDLGHGNVNLRITPLYAT